MSLRTSRSDIVDLAGSERVNDTNADGKRLKELCRINNSLSNLGKVIYELSESSKKYKDTGFINFKESKLTHILNDTLGGNEDTLMICTLNPHISALNETSFALKFALRAKMIKYKAVVNDDSSYAEYWKKKYL